MPTRSHTLQLPRPGMPPQPSARGRRRRRRPLLTRCIRAAFGLLLLLGGCALLGLLMLLTQRLNALLLVSTAIVNLIRGLQLLGLALLQLLVMLLVVLLVLLALVLLIGGAMRLLRALWPRPAAGASGSASASQP